MHSRRIFLAAGTAALGVAGALAPPVSAASPYDFEAIARRLELPFRHRQAFGAHRLADGNIADFMLNSLNAYQFDYDDGPGTMHVAGIFYGTAIAMILDDAAWRKYKLGTVQERRDDPVKKGDGNLGNPYLAPASSLNERDRRDDLHGFYHDPSLAALEKRGATFFACNNALRGLATDIAVSYGLSDEGPDAVLAALQSSLVPGTLLVPAGVASINQVQEMKFTYLQASL
jgi:intracellular sulfur oxidation DsrE/DsrF family protein